MGEILSLNDLLDEKDKINLKIASGIADRIVWILNPTNLMKLKEENPNLISKATRRLGYKSRAEGMTESKIKEYFESVDRRITEKHISLALNGAVELERIYQDLDIYYY